MRKIILISAVVQELTYLVDSLGGKWSGNEAHFTCNDTSFCAVVTGIGMINTALHLGRHLEKDDFDAVWMLGCCGSYCEDIATGDVIVAQSETNGDLGIAGEDGWISPVTFNFHIIETEKGSYMHHFPCFAPSLERLDVKNFGVHCGNLLSLSTVSATLSHAQTLKNRHDVVAENMEGAAAAQVAAIFDKALVEIRGVSNRAGERDKRHWDFKSSWKNSQELGKELLHLEGWI